jgi:hypothetical protein
MINAPTALGGHSNQHREVPAKGGGEADHVHLLIALPPILDLSGS